MPIYDTDISITRPTSGLMAAILNFGSRTTSGNVGGDIVKSGMADKVGVAVGIAALSLAVQTLFPLPVFAGRHLGFWWPAIVYQRRSAYGSVPSVKSKSGVVGNVLVAFEIVSLRTAVHLIICRSKVISSSGLVAAILNRSSPTSGDVDVVIVMSVMIENVGVTVGIMSVCC